MSRCVRDVLVVGVLAVCGWSAELLGAQIVEHPFLGITHVTRTETSPRNVTMHIVKIDLTVPSIRFMLTPPGGARETVRQTTLGFLNQVHAQVAINSHFFLPHPSPDTDAWLLRNGENYPLKYLGA